MRLMRPASEQCSTLNPKESMQPRAPACMLCDVCCVYCILISRLSHTSQAIPTFAPLIFTHAERRTQQRIVCAGGVNSHSEPLARTQTHIHILDDNASDDDDDDDAVGRETHTLGDVARTCDDDKRRTALRTERAERAAQVRCVSLSVPDRLNSSEHSCVGCIPSASARLRLRFGSTARRLGGVRLWPANARAPLRT